jgi:hypothetical protein
MALAQLLHSGFGFNGYRNYVLALAFPAADRPEDLIEKLLQSGYADAAAQSTASLVDQPDPKTGVLMKRAFFIKAGRDGPQWENDEADHHIRDLLHILTDHGVFNLPEIDISTGVRG